MIGIYVCDCDLTDSSSGVSKKIHSQVALFEKSGYKMLVFDKNSFAMEKPSKVKVLARIVFEGVNSKVIFESLRKISEIVSEEKVDFIYIRQGYFDKKMMSVLGIIKKRSPNTKIIYEIPTYPYNREINFNQIPQIVNDSMARKNAKKVIDRVVTYSNDKSIFSIKTINLSNGIDYSSLPYKRVGHEGVNLIAVALFARWHGYDRVIKAFGKNKSFAMANKLHLHLVGDGKELRKYKRLICKYSLGDLVTIHGPLSGESLDKVYEIADVALDSMGRHRDGVYFNSSLKGKEYCARGLPIVSGVTTELDSFRRFDYYWRVSADEKPILLPDLLSFCQKCYLNHNHNEIAEIIRTATRPRFDFDNSFLPVVEYIKELHG